MKNNLEFYRHDANSHNHQKFKMLRARYGWEGEGKFWALNNIIAQAENCCLNLSKKYNRAAVALDLDFSLENFEEFLEFLSNPDECNLLRCENGKLYTNDFLQDNLSQVMATREASRKRRGRSHTFEENHENDTRTSGEHHANDASTPGERQESVARRSSDNGDNSPEKEQKTGDEMHKEREKEKKEREETEFRRAPPPSSEPRGNSDDEDPFGFAPDEEV